MLFYIFLLGEKIYYVMIDVSILNELFSLDKVYCLKEKGVEYDDNLLIVFVLDGKLVEEMICVYYLKCKNLVVVSLF